MESLNQTEQISHSNTGLAIGIILVLIVSLVIYFSTKKPKRRKVYGKNDVAYVRESEVVTKPKRKRSKKVKVAEEISGESTETATTNNNTLG